MTPPRKTAPEALLPLKPVVFQVLLALADGERHGYAIVQDIAQRTSARMRLEPGNLYRSLKWMLEGGLIEESTNGARHPISTMRGAGITASPHSATGWPWLRRRACGHSPPRPDESWRAARDDLP